MPVTYEYVPERELVIGECTGKLTIHCITDCFRSLSKDDEIPPGFSVFVVLEKAESFEFYYNDIELVADLFPTVRTKKKIKKTILVANNDLSYGIARMFEAMHTPQDHVIAVRSIEEAERLLAR